MKCSAFRACLAPNGMTRTCPDLAASLRIRIGLLRGSRLSPEINAPQQKSRGDEQHGEGREGGENVDIGEVSRLIYERLANPGDGPRLGVGTARAMGREIAAGLAQHLPVGKRGRRDVLGQSRLVKLLAPGKQGLRHRDADAASEIACHVDQGGCLAGLLGGRPT